MQNKNKVLHVGDEIRITDEEGNFFLFYGSAQDEKTAQKKLSWIKASIENLITGESS